VSSIPEALKAALADRYRLDRELGAGGMATVYLAEDLKHHRKVAVKVLRPDLAVALGADRFLREIEVAARLQHPHILGVLDSGDADGFFYYVMPYVEGETLRDKITRTGELPLAEAVRLLSEITEALATAHRSGVVHRDIKPENILLSGRHAMVMDFGVAKAVTEASGRQQLTTAGIALGTPAYMAPEQASADPQMDGRVDIYAIGIMAYEMLTGYTPFHGLNPQQTLAAHMTREPTPIGTQRKGMSPALEAVIMRCLEKRPADRFQNADELFAAFEPLATSGGMTPTSTQPVKAHRVSASHSPERAKRNRMIAIGATVAIVAGILVWRPWSRIGAKLLDPKVVAVLPFRVAGADPSVQYLRQGMVDLLQAKLTGQGGPRSADTRSVLAAFRDAGGDDTHDLVADAVDKVARKILAGRVLQGSIVGPANQLVIEASLLEMPGGRTVAQATVNGPKDSLFVLVDRLTAQLLALGAGAQASQLSALTTTNLEALRLYLDGVAAFRRGGYAISTPTFERAVALDSSFALALSALVESDGWHASTNPRGMRRVRRLAWEHRSRLNPRDQLMLQARIGSLYPRYTPFDVQIADAERMVQSMPESADAWHLLGDALFHGGRLADIVEPEKRAKQAFEKAFRLDSLYAGPISHMVRIAFLEGDTVAQKLWTARQVALDSTAEGIIGSRWDLLQMRKDAAGVDRWVKELPTRSLYDYTQVILFQNPQDSITIAHQPALLAAFHTLAVDPGERTEMSMMHVYTLLNRGRPGEAGRWLDTLRTVRPGDADLLALLGQLYYGVSPVADTTIMSPNNREWAHMVGGDQAAGQRVLAWVRGMAVNDTSGRLWPRLTALAEAITAVNRRDPNAERLVDVADSLFVGMETNAEWASIQLARLFESQGRTDKALRAVRRRYSSLGEPNPQGLAGSYRLEGLLAAKAGDKAGAIRAYRNYLKMRVDPEPSMIPQRDSVVAALKAIGDVEGAR
jgi:eukaryotic-like serine/threonine-protein kinase